MAERGRLFSGGRIGINKSCARALRAASGPFGGKVYYFLPWMERERERVHGRDYQAVTLFGQRARKLGHNSRSELQ